MKLWLALMCVVSLGMASMTEAVFEKARQEKKLVWVFVELPTCPWCAKMHKEVVESGVYARALSASYVLVRMEGKEARELGFNVAHFPTSLLIHPVSQKVVELLPGYMKVEDFVEYLTLVYDLEKDGL
ncbi:MAG: thioredoxin family protein [Campylobacterales bacterium]|nr:thioredoxin family protein [Campylobacterales bacterium]